MNGTLSINGIGPAITPRLSEAQVLMDAAESGKADWRTVLEHEEELTEIMGSPDGYFDLLTLAVATCGDAPTF